MDKEIKKAEVAVYDHSSEKESEYGEIWNDKHFQRLLEAGPGGTYCESLKAEARDSRVLVIGCGQGANVRSALEADAAGVVGIELSATRLQDAADSVSDPKAAFGRADAEQLPFQSGSFDVVLSHSVLHHLPNWRTVALEEVRRVLASDGSLLLYEPGQYNPPAAIRRHVYPSNIHTPDETPFDPNELERILTRHFESVKLEGHCLVSNIVPVLANHLPIPLRTAPMLYDLERRILDYRIARRFAWVLTGVAKLPKPASA